MIGFCIESPKDGEYIFTFEGECPEVGMKYLLESAVDGSLAQNNLFHSLVTEYWKSGLSSYHSESYNEFRNRIKRYLGEGFDGFRYFTIEEIGGRYIPKRHFVKKKEDIPPEILSDEHMQDFVLGNLRSWASYTKRQRKKCIDNLITEMLAAGCNSKKFEEILKGINYGL